MIETDNRGLDSILLLFGTIQWILTVLVMEGIKPGYVSSTNYVSTLGTGEASWVYNLSTVILGACVATASILIRRRKSSRAFFYLFLIAGLATIGVGVFPEDSRPIHGFVTPMALIFGALAAIFSYKIHDKPASYFSVMLGTLSLVTGIIFVPFLGLPVESKVMFLGLYKGTLERIVIYTNLLWIMILGSQLSKT